MTHRTGHRLAPPRPTSVPCPTATLCQDSSLKCHARARDSRVTSSRVPTCAIGGHERERTRPACRETCATHQPSADEQQTLIVHTAGSPRWRMARRCNRTPCSALISARLRPIRPSGPTAPVTPIRVLGASSRRRVLPQRRRRLEHAVVEDGWSTQVAPNLLVVPFDYREYTHERWPARRRLSERLEVFGPRIRLAIAHYDRGDFVLTKQSLNLFLEVLAVNYNFDVVLLFDFLSKLDNLIEFVLLHEVHEQKI